VLTKILKTKKDDLREQFALLRNEEVRDRYRSLNIDRTVKHRRLRWAGHVVG
jgi:hypothetical protein